MEKYQRLEENDHRQVIIIPSTLHEISQFKFDESEFNGRITTMDLQRLFEEYYTRSQSFSVISFSRKRYDLFLVGLGFIITMFVFFIIISFTGANHNIFWGVTCILLTILSLILLLMVLRRRKREIKEQARKYFETLSNVIRKKNEKLEGKGIQFEALTHAQIAIRNV